jgi:cytochrome c
MKFNNKPTFEMLSVKAKHDGFEIEFTQPLKANLSLKETDLTIQQWWYLPTNNYGGPKMDLVNLSPTQITISKDRKKVYVKLSNLKPKHVVYFSLSNQIKNQKNQSLWSGEAWYTLNAIPKEI